MCYLHKSCQGNSSAGDAVKAAGKSKMSSYTGPEQSSSQLLTVNDHQFIWVCYLCAELNLNATVF